MPRKCCVPDCKGNYSSGPKVSVFLFPKDESIRQKWMQAIHRDDFDPTNQSVVCELHFQTNDIEREASLYDPKSGRLITAPLDRPRLKKDAVPSQLPGCPSYLSKASSSREDPEQRRERLEHENLSAAIEESVSSHLEYITNITFNSLDEMVSKVKLNDEWMLLRKDSIVYFILICEAPFLKILCYVAVNSDLVLTVHVKDTQLKQVGSNNFPLIVNDINKLTAVLDEVYATFKKSEAAVKDKLQPQYHGQKH